MVGLLFPEEPMTVVLLCAIPAGLSISLKEIGDPMPPRSRSLCARTEAGSVYRVPGGTLWGPIGCPPRGGLSWQ